MKKDLNKLIDDRIEKALNSGAFELNDYEDDFLLPKIFMTAMGKEISFQYRPHSKEALSEVKNLELFL